MKRQGQALPVLGLALLLTGCGPDRPAAQMPPRAYAPPSSPAVSASAAATAPAVPDNPLTASASDSITPTSDPLIGDAGSPAKDPLAGSDPLKGPKMPTEHSHWLRGQVRGGHVLVSLNGIRLGDFSGFVDRDITMRLRAGINTAVFTFQPDSPQSAATLDVLESEHHPPIPPLATFDAAPVSGLTATSTPKPRTQTFLFTAQ